MEPFFLDVSGCRLEAGFWACEAPKIQGGFLLVPGLWGDFKRRAFTGLCGRLRERAPVMAVNMRGHGRSGGLFTFGDRELEDLSAVFGALQDRGLLPVRCIGFSMGGWVLTRFLAEQESWRGKTRHLVLAGVPSRLPWVMPRPWLPGLWVQLAKGGKGLVRPNLRALLRSRDLAGAAEGLGSLPVTVVHGRSDWMVHHRHGERLYRSLLPPKRWVLVENPMKLHVEMLALSRPEVFVEALAGEPPESPAEPP